MALTKYKLGSLIETIDIRNDDEIYSSNDVRGISTNKEFIGTKANLDGVSLKSYKIVKKHEFAYVSDTSRRGDKIALAFNNDNKNYIVSSIYTVFKVKDTSIVLSDYLFIYFNRPEFDRYSRFNSWGSARETFSWEDMCDIEIELPTIDIQQKYVDVYNSMIANQKAYESRLEDLRIVCDGHFDVVKKEKMVPLGTGIEKVDKRNSDGKYGIQDVRGIMNQKQFSETKANVESKDLTKFLVIDKDVFAYNSRTDGREMLVLAVNRCDKSVIVTWNYNAFRIRDEKRRMINTEYLYAFFKRREFDREVRFNSWGSSQELLSWDSLCDLNVPCPDINTQNSIAEINRVYLDRKDINDKLKSVIKDACSVLIKGSIEEAQKEA